MHDMLLFTCLIGVSLLLLPRPAAAVPPPDFLFAVGSQMGVFFSVLLIFFSGAVGFIRTLARGAFARIRHPRTFWVLLSLTVVGASLALAWMLEHQRQARLAQEWLSETQPPDVQAERVASVTGTVSSSQGSSVKSEGFGSAASSRIALVPPAGTPISVGNAELSALLQTGQAFVLDAREDEEWEVGRLPGAMHVRFADLVAGAWQDLPRERTVYVLCWSGIRGKEVAEFLRQQGVEVRYLEKGALGWVEEGRAWEGKIRFRDVHTEEEFRIVYDTDHMRQYVAEGVFVIDSRPASKYARKHLPGSLNIPLIYTPSSQNGPLLDHVPAGSRVITVCDDYVNCFDATVMGLKLQQRGHTFLGRYNKPWEW